VRDSDNSLIEGIPKEALEKGGKRNGNERTKKFHTYKTGM
jgi:hypothetical protein